MTKKDNTKNILIAGGILGIIALGATKIFGKNGESSSNETQDGSVQLVITRALPLNVEMTLTGIALKGVPAPDMLLEILVEDKGSLTYKVIYATSYFNVVLNSPFYLDVVVTPQSIQVLGGLISNSYGTQKFKGRMTLTNISGTGTVETDVVSATLGEP